MKKSILLDLDGTLIDPYSGISRCILYALDEMRIPRPSADDLRNWIGPPLMTSFTSWFQDQAIDADAGQALLLYRERFSTKGLFENQLYPGISGLLRELVTAGNRVFLATSKPAVYAKQILGHFRLEKYFSGVYGSELDGRYTDKRDLLTMILQQQDLLVQDCVMVGDRHHDIDAAGAHGMTSYGVLWGYGSRAELEGAGADRIIESVAELASALA